MPPPTSQPSQMAPSGEQHSEKAGARQGLPGAHWWHFAGSREVTPFKPEILRVFIHSILGVQQSRSEQLFHDAPIPDGLGDLRLLLEFHSHHLRLSLGMHPRGSRFKKFSGSIAVVPSAWAAPVGRRIFLSRRY